MDILDVQGLDPEQLAQLDEAQLARLQLLLKEQENRSLYNRADTYNPYPWQKDFHKAGAQAAQRLLMAGNRCITPWTYIQTDHGAAPALEVLHAPSACVQSWDGTTQCNKTISGGFLKSIEPAFRVVMDTGEFFDCTRKHRVLTDEGYVSLDQLMSLSNGLRYKQKLEDYQASCALGGYLSDRQLQLALNTVQGQSPLLAYAHKSDRLAFSHKDAMERTPQCIRVCRKIFLLSNPGDLGPISALYEQFSAPAVYNAFLPLTEKHQELVQLASESDPVPLSLPEDSLHAQEEIEIFYPSSHPLLVGGSTIVAVVPLGYQPIIDGTVEDTHCYWAGGVVHHNTGKTFSGADEMAFHLTGRYPDWWEGRKFDRPIAAWASGVSNAKTRDIVQRETLGDPEDPTMLGTGTIPLDCIVSTVRLPGVPNAVQSVLVKHYTDGVYDGNSRLGFLSYEMGEEKFMGSSLDVIWLDEQPAQNIFTQCITRTADTGGMVYMTFTPEQGLTPVVNQFMNDIKPGQALIQATWDDCPHLTEEVKEQLLAVYLPHEREMRAKGLPVFGSGLVFPVSDEQVMCQPFDIPRFWPRIAAIDFGWDHPTAFAFIAIDPADGTQYVYAAWKQSKVVPAIHAVSVREVDGGLGETIPMVWPHDGAQHDKGSGATLADQYRDEGLNMLPFCFTNPPAPGEAEGSGGRSVDAGIMAMLTKMEAGKFKVFSTLHDWFTEKQMYHRDEGKIVKLNDDIMAATRYASQCARFALPLSANGFNMTGQLSMPKVETC